MRIRTIILCLAIFLIEIQLVAQTVPCIPADRRVDWSNAGLLPNTAVTAEAVIHVDDYTGTDDQRVNFALSEARSYHQSNPNHLVIIHFSPRNYYFSNTIALTKLDNNTVFQGEGSDRTHLVFDQASSNSHCISLLGTDYPYYNLQDNIIIPKESYNLYGNWSSYEISNSNWIHFTESYFDYEHPVANEEYIVGQITLLLNVAGTLGEMKDAASKTYQDYDHGYPNQLRVRKIEPIMNVGFENFKLTRVTSQKGDGLNFKIQYAVNCWIKGIESQHTAKHHIVIYYSSHIEVSGNYFYDAVDLGGGGFGYGVLLYASTTNCLVENNIFKNLRHAMIVGGGANCNVYDYNYSREQKWDEDDEVYGLGIKGPDICIHGKYSYANLFEGNVADRIWLDAYHGTSGPYNTIFRNRTNQNEPIIIFNADYTNVIGNDKATTALHDPDNGLAWLAELFGVGHVIDSRYCFDLYFWMYDELLDWSVYTGITHGGWYAYQELGANWVTYVLGHSFINDISYYYSERPSFIPASSYTWPPNGPQTNLDWNMTTYPTGWRIPAEDSWEQSVKTYIPDLIIWPPQPPETIEGILTEDQIWRDDILISGDVTVPSGVTVTILANTEVKFQDYYKITVEEGGHISAIGTEYHPIVFKPTTGNSNNKWNQIKLYHTGDNVFKHCTFEYAYYPIYMLSCDDSYGGPNIFENCVFKNNYKYGAYVRGSVAEFTACEIKDNVSYGLYLYTSEVNLTGNRIKNNSRGIVSRSSSDLDLFGNVIENNTQYGLMTYYYDNTKLGSFSTGPYYYGRNTVWNNNSAEVYAYRSNPDVQLIANYIEGEGWGTGDWEVKNYSSNTNDVYCAYGWWGDDELESSGLVTNANQSYLPCGFIIGQTLLEEPAAKQTVQAVSAGDLEIDPYLPLDEKIALAKQIIAEKSNNKEAIDALDLIYSILRSDFRENQLDERNDFVGYLVSLEAQYSNKALGIRALQYLILWRILSGQDDEVIALSDKALKKVSKEDGNMLIGDLAYTYLTRCA